MDYEASEQTKKRMEIKMTSSRLCELCRLEVLEVRDIRKRPILCGGCEGKRGMFRRYESFDKGGVTEDERLKILNSPTTRTGPFFKYQSDIRK